MAQHGTTTRYRRGCRCQPCRDTKQAQQQAYQVVNPEKGRERQRRYQEKTVDIAAALYRELTPEPMPGNRGRQLAVSLYRELQAGGVV